VRITNSSGVVVNTYDYDDYGNIISQTENIANDYTYTGKERDKDSGLYYYGARYYDPSIGRWLTKDPLQNMFPAMRHLRNAQKLNRYSYVLNNPLNLVDIWGLDGTTAGVGGAGSTAGGGGAGAPAGPGGTAGIGGPGSGGDGSGKGKGNGNGPDTGPDTNPDPDEPGTPPEEEGEGGRPDVTPDLRIPEIKKGLIPPTDSWHLGPNQ